jgi:hypothetical protein
MGLSSVVWKCRSNSRSVVNLNMGRTSQIGE